MVAETPTVLSPQVRFRVVLSSSPVRIPALAVATLVLAAGCGGDDAPVAAEQPEVLALAEIEPEPTTPPPAPTAVPPTATPAPTPTPTPTPWAIAANVEERLPEGWNPHVEADLAVGPTDQPPAGAVLGAIGTQANRWSYTAVVGRLRPRQELVEATVAPPEHVAGTAPLTGLPDVVADRPALVVKIDNVPAARPQTGLNEADIIYEELVEGGVTRFAAVFHSEAPATIGPVRSGRSTDIGIIDSFNRPIFAFSGANSIFDGLIDKQPIQNRGAEVFTGYWRNGSRPAPHNLFTGADTMLASAERTDAPPAHFTYRADGEAVADGQPASLIQLRYAEGGSAAIEFRWNADVDGWQRWQSGSAHVDSAGVQLAPQNVVVQFIDYLDTGMTDKWGEDLYEGVTVGSGRALVFTDGTVVEASWERPSLRSVTTFTAADGTAVALTPGQTFVALIAPGGASWGS